MRTPLQKLASQRRNAQHPGLLLNRYLAEQNDDGADKRALFEAACAAANDAGLVHLYQLAFRRWRESFSSGIRATVELATPPHTRLVVGLGNKGVIEAGLRLHHTYGLPLIPGSALKGVASHYAAEVWGVADPRYSAQGEFHQLLFGSADDSGVICFEDAWFYPDCLRDTTLGLRLDVMTPHHQKWQTEAVAPTDFDSPVPVPFLSVAGRFEVVVSWQGPTHPQAEAWTKRTLVLLEEALSAWGVGGKTSSGYGRLIRQETGSGQKQVPASQSQVGTGPPKKRDSNTRVRVTIVGPREKGFNVQEEGRPQGVLIPGQPPGVSTEPGSVVDVLIHNDDPRKPQYKWPMPRR